MTHASPSGLVAPFRGGRYADEERLSQLIAPPYDVIDPAMREELYARDHRNVVHFILPAGEVEDRYERAAQLLDSWRREGEVIIDDAPGLYVIRQRFSLPEGRRATRTGVIGAVAVEPLSTGRILPHERTHAGPKRDRLALLEASQATFESLFMLTRDTDGALQDAVTSLTAKQPTMVASLDGVDIEAWYVHGPTATELADLAGREQLYIADGHHRYETAVAYASSNPRATRVPALVVSLHDPGLVVLATHRTLQESISDDAIEVLREHFDIREVDSREQGVQELEALRSRGTACAVLTPERTFVLLLKRTAVLGPVAMAYEQPVASLDVARIDTLVVDHLNASAGGGKIGYSADSADVIAAIDHSDIGGAVLINPPKVEHVLEVADARATMPPKSTYFIPKVASGLVAMVYDAQE